MSEGSFGYLRSIAILFLLFQMAQAKPTKVKRIKFTGKGPLPSSHVSDRFFTEDG
jgi:hypothetical protein